jgi:hypothetical protein
VAKTDWRRLGLIAALVSTACGLARFVNGAMWRSNYLRTPLIVCWGYTSMGALFSTACATRLRLMAATGLAATSTAALIILRVLHYGDWRLGEPLRDASVVLTPLFPATVVMVACSAIASLLYRGGSQGNCSG